MIFTLANYDLSGNYPNSTAIILISSVNKEFIRKTAYLKVYPPSIVIISPVVNEAASEAR